MPIFRYKALNEEKEVISGLVEAPDEKVAAEILNDNNLSVISLGLKKKFVLKNYSFNWITNKDIVVFSRQLAVMISANVALVQALEITADQTPNPKLKKVILDIANEVDGGARLSEAFAKQKGIFSEFFVSIIKSGETSGKLDDVMNYLADEMEKDFDMMAKIKGAMIYPLIVVILLIVVGVFMIIYVIPQLTTVLTESGVALPLPTRILVGTSAFLSKYIILIIIGVILGVFALRYYLKTPNGKRNRDILTINLPVLGNLFRMIYLVRFTRSLNTLIMGGVTISDSLSVAANVVGNEIYKELINKTLREVESGNSISSVFKDSPEVPQMVSQMLSIGEKTGKLDLVLSKVTDFYTREINNIVANLMTLMEPFVIIIMGAGVLIMILAFIMPMYSLINQI